MSERPPSTQRGDATLSPEGIVRRRAILEHAQQALTGRVRARRARRSLMALALLAVATGVTLNIWQQQETTPNTRVAKAPPDPDTPVERAAVAHSSPAASQPTIVVETLDDDSMLATLASLGINAGMIEVDGVQRLVTPDGGPLDLAAYSNRARSTIDRPKHPHDV